MRSTGRKRRFVTGLLALACSLAATPLSAAEVQGLAFIHGTGKHTNAARDYWQAPIIDTVRQGLPDRSKYTVINCDFDQYMWSDAAAGCLADQLTRFIQDQGVTRLVLVTHSNGGNVVRWILSNPTYDRRYPGIIQRVQKVTALAPSSAGTPLADAVITGNSFDRLLGWLLGYQNDAVRMQQVSHMAVHNAQKLYGTPGRPALPKPFRAVVGSDVNASPFGEGGTCGGYATSVALKLIKSVWLSSCADGFLDCSSQRAAGTTLFIDTQRTRGAQPLNHNQSRGDCSGLAAILRDDLAG